MRWFLPSENLRPMKFRRNQTRERTPSATNIGHRLICSTPFAKTPNNRKLNDTRDDEELHRNIFSITWTKSFAFPVLKHYDLLKIVHFKCPCSLLEDVICIVHSSVSVSVDELIRLLLDSVARFRHLLDPCGRHWRWRCRGEGEGIWGKDVLWNGVFLK